MKTKTNWKEIIRKSDEAASNDDMRRFFRIQSEAAAEIAVRVAQEVEGYPKKATPIVIAALEAVLAACQASATERERKIYRAAADVIRKPIMSATMKVPSEYLQEEKE